jgi:hypothetical protein
MMVRRAAWLLVRWVAGLVAALAFVAGFLIWRLSSGPISLDYLAPYVAGSIAGPESGIRVQIDHTLLSLGEGSGIDILAQGVHLERTGGAAQLTLPEMALGFSLRAALRGIIAPTRIVLDAPELRLVRALDGTFHLGLGDETPGAGDWGEDLLRDIAGPPDRRGSLSYLTRVAVRRAVLIVEDRALGVTWRARQLEATLRRGADGSIGDIALTVVQPGGEEARFRGNFRYVLDEGRVALQLGFADLRPALFADAAPGLAPLAVVQLPLSGRVRVTLDTAVLRISDAACDVSLGAGRIVHAALVGGGIDVAAGELRVSYQPSAGRVTLERLRIDIGGPSLQLTGSVDGVGDGVLAGGLPTAIDLAGELRLGQLPVDALAKYWPEQLSPRTRSWITEHIHDGEVDGLVARLGGHVDLSANAAQPVQVDTIEGSFDYRDLTIEYFKPLTPLRGVNGSASFNRAQLELVPTAGAVAAVRLAGGSAKLDKLDTDNEEITIDLGLRGPVRDVLEVLDSKPLRYAHELKLDPAAVSGAVDGRVRFVFPLKHDLTLDMVDYGARAALSDVAIEKVVADRDLTAGELQLQLDRSAVKLDGTARLADVPASVTWTQSLKAKDQVRARYLVKAQLDDAARRRLDVDFLPGMVKGPVAVDLTYTLAPAKRATMAVSLDLKGATIEATKLNWRKPPGVPATGRLDLDFLDERLRALRQAAIKGDGLDLRFALALDDVGGGVIGITRADLSRVAVGDTDVAGTVTRRSEGGWRVELRGPSLDASGLIAGGDKAATGDQPDPPLIIDAALDRVLLGPKREARDVKGQLYSDGVHWQAAGIDAALAGGGKVSLRFGEAAGDRNLRLSTDDLGGLMHLFDISDNVAGGQLEVTGQIDDSGAARVLRGKAQGADYRLVGAPVFARLLSLASLSGIGALLSGEGIPFTRLKSDFALSDGKLEVKDLRAYGGAIGLNANGVYDLNADTLDFSGTLVPAYTINSVLGNIPILGKILLGGEGEGIFGANFRVAGPSSDARITVNPLSALAPGFLRKLFLFDAPEPSTPAPPAQSGSTQRR